MKKLLMSLAFLTVVLPAISQMYVSIDGYVTNISNGTAIPNHAVTIVSDSSFGWVYYQTVYTNPNGFYVDTIPVPVQTSGTLYIMTVDCQNYVHQQTVQFSPAVNHFTVNFSICYNNIPCTADFSYYQYAPRSIEFTDQSQPGGNTVIHYWNFGDGTTSNLINPQHVYSLTGWYNVTLTIADQQLGCTATVTKQVYANDSTGGGCQAAFTYEQSVPLTLQFYDGSIGGDSLRLWNFGDGTTSTELNPVHIYPEHGFYTVILTIGTPGTNCYSTIWQTPYVWGDSTGGGCQAYYYAVPDSLVNTPNTFQFYDQSAGNIVAWMWNFGDPASGANNVSTLQNPIHTFTSPGYYNVCLSVQGADSACFDSYCDTLYAGSQPGCQAGFITQQLQPLAVHFYDASVGGGNIRQWSFGDGGTSSELNPVHTYPQPGYYNVTLTIGAPGTICNSTVTQTISVWDSTGGACQAAFHAIEEIIDSVSTYHFYDESTGNIAYWYWHFGDPNSGVNNTSTLQNPDHIFSGPGTYNVCLTVRGTDSTCYSTICMSIVVGGVPTCRAAFTYYADSSNTGTTIHFIDLSTGDLSYWHWSFGDGTYSTEQNPVHTYPGQGYYLVSLTVSSANQWCSDQVSDTIRIGSGPGCQAYFNYSQDPANGNRTVTFTDLSTGSPTAWFWNFGDGTAGYVQNPAHTYAGPGTYSVCLTITGNNCTSTYCRDVVIQDSTIYHQVYGQVFAGNFPLSSGLALIFSLDTTANYQPYVNVCPIDSNGIYYFTLVPDGNYYIMAIPIIPGGYLPTYYGNTIMWQQAALIQLGAENNPYDINLVPAGSMTYGPGSVSGQIGMTGLKSTMLDKINMFLMNDQGSPIGYTNVSTSGDFDFGSLAYGTYYLRPEMPGVTSDMIRVTLTADQPHADVIMTFTGNRILGMQDGSSGVAGWSLYPNPVSDRLSVNIDLKEEAVVSAEIFSLAGSLMSSTTVGLHAGLNKIAIETTSLPAGIYMLRVHSSGGFSINAKIVKVY